MILPTEQGDLAVYKVQYYSKSIAINTEADPQTVAYLDRSFGKIYLLANLKDIV